MAQRIALAVDWQWGDRYLRAGLGGKVVGRDHWGRSLVMLDCFTEDSAPQAIDTELLRPSKPNCRPR